MNVLFVVPLSLSYSDIVNCSYNGTIEYSTNYFNRLLKFMYPLGVLSIASYIKSKFALMEALRVQVESSYLGSFAEIDPRTVKHDPPIKV